MGELWDEFLNIGEIMHHEYDRYDLYCNLFDLSADVREAYENLQEENDYLKSLGDCTSHYEKEIQRLEKENQILETALNDMIAMHFDDNSQPISYGKNGETYCRYLRMDNLTCKKQSTISWSDCEECYKNQLLLNAKYQTLLKGINNHESNN